MGKRSMVVDLHKLARKYPAEVRALFDAMAVDRMLAKVRRVVSSENGNLNERGRIKRPTFDGVPALPEWKTRRLLGWKGGGLFALCVLDGIRTTVYHDGSHYFCAQDVERVAARERARRAARLTTAATPDSWACVEALPVMKAMRRARPHTMSTPARGGRARDAVMLKSEEAA